MQTPTAVWAAIAMISVTISGCIGGGGDLDMLVTPSDDPVTEPFLFEATGPKFDHYEWDFSDGTAVAEGAEVEHLFGFTNGDIVVRLTAHNEGEDDAAITIARTVELGGTRNVNPVGVLTANTYWVDPGEAFAVTTAGSSDADGDPLLYRWTVERIGDLVAPDTSHPPHEGLGGVPFGVDAWAGLDTNLTADGTDYGADLVDALSAAQTRPWSTTETAIQGSITESGVYAIESFIRDPKGTPWVGRYNVYVSEPDRLKPDETATLHVEGEFSGGFSGGFQSVWDDGATVPVVDQPVPSISETTGEEMTFDRLEEEFSIIIPSLSGTIDFSYESQTGDAGTVIEYQILTAGGTTVVPANSEATRELGKDDLRNEASGGPREYVVVFTMTPSGAQASMTFDMTIQNDLDPLNWYERLI